MHIPDGFLNIEVSATTYAVSGVVVALALWKARKTLEDRAIPLMGVTSAFIFAAQMINFPVAGGTSGHFLGAVLASIILGPLLGCLIMSMVLLMQCLGFADGGLTALGANIFNMGIVAGIGGYWIYRILKIVLPANRWGMMIAISLASWCSIVFASVMCALELALSGTSPLLLVFSAMVGIHSIIGLGEAMITVAVVSLVLAYRPDLMRISETTEIMWGEKV